MSEIEIHQAEMDDLEMLLENWVALLDSQQIHGAHLFGEPNRETARDVLSQYISSESVLVARTEFQMVGFVMFHVASGMYEQRVTRGIIDNVFVVKDRRDEGIGSQLLDAAEAAFADTEVDVIGISVLAANDRARELYEDRGYEAHRIELERPV